MARGRHLHIEKVNKYEFALSMVSEAYGAMVEAYAHLNTKVAEVQVASLAVEAECGQVRYHLDGIANLTEKASTGLIDSITRRVK